RASAASTTICATSALSRSRMRVGRMVQQMGIQGFDLARDHFFGEALTDTGEALRRQGSAQFGAGMQIGERAGERAGVAGRGEESAESILDHFGDAAAGRRNHGNSGGHGFDGGAAE